MLVPRHDNGAGVQGRTVAGNQFESKSHQLTGIYEPSAVQQLADGRFLVVEDEKARPFSAFSFDAAGGVQASELKPGLLQFFSSAWQLEDLEGLAIDGSDFVYAITSFSRTDEGRENKNREKLIRFRIDGDRLVDGRVARGLKRALTGRHPALARAAAVRDVKNGGGLNIEALDVSPDQQQLLIGFRGPLVDGSAVVARVGSLPGLFEGGEPDVGATLELLDLGGAGIRSMSFVPWLGEYLVVGGPLDKLNAGFTLWLWQGPSGSVRRVHQWSADLSRCEGVCPALIDARESLVLVRDDGDRKAGRSATFSWLDATRLKTA
jgi:hypothetical protein